MEALRLSHEVGALSAFANEAGANVDEGIALLDATRVEAQDFEQPEHGRLWAILETIVREGRRPDVVEVESRLPGFPRQLLVEVMVAPSSGFARERLLVVREKGQRRRVANTLTSLARLLTDGRRPFAEAVSEAKKALEHISTGEPTSSPADSDVVRIVDHLAEAAQGERDPVQPCGIGALDAVIGGLQPTLTVIGALPGVGKSGLLAAVVRNLARQNVKVGFFSLEDERQWVARRLMSEASGVPLFVMNNRRLTSGQLDRVVAASAGLHEPLKNLIIEDQPGMTAAEVVASARDMMVRHGVKVVMVDHLGEIRVARADRHDLEIADALRELRSLAKTYGVPVVVACHLRRRDGLGVDSEPRLTDFAFSAAVERMCRVGLALSKPNEETLRVHVLKQTNGMANVSVNLTFNGPCGVVKNDEAEAVRERVDADYAAQVRRIWGDQ